MAGIIRERLIRGFGGQAFGQAVAFTVQIASVPLFLHFWGAELYGEWLLLAAVPAYLVISDLGFTTATTHEVTMRVARGETDAALGAFQTTWALVSVLSLAVGALLVVGATFAPLAAWFGFATLDDVSAVAVLALLLFQVLVNIQMNQVAAGLISAGRYGLHTFLAALTRLVAFLAVVAVLAGGGGPLEVALALAGIECAGFVVIAGFARRSSPWLRHGVTRVSLAIARRLAGPSVGFLAFIVANAIQVQGPVIVVGAVLGPSATTVFVTLRMVARAAIIAGNVVFATVRPEIAMAYGNDDGALMRRLNNRSAQFALWLAGASLVFLLLAGPAIVELWTVGRIAAEQPLFFLLLVSGAATVMWIGVASALYATNNNREIAAAFVALSALGVAGATAGALAFGLKGVALGLALAELAMLAVVVARTLRFLEQAPGDLFLAALRPPSEALRALLRRQD